jgi:hypothetical protein
MRGSYRRGYLQGYPGDLDAGVLAVAKLQPGQATVGLVSQHDLVAAAVGLGEARTRRDGPFPAADGRVPGG